VGVIYGTLEDCFNRWRNLAELPSLKTDWVKWMLPMFLAMHLPLLVLCCFHLPSVYYVYATVIAEQFDMVLVCCLFMMYLTYIAEGESKNHIML
jgi:PAT family beta-lactamase induction signal transducer AmpG